MNNYLKKIYFDPAHPASFGSALKLYNQSKKDKKPYTLADAKKFLSTSEVYTTHRKVIRRFPRRKIVSGGLGESWQSDLADVKAIKDQNGGMQFLLVSIDVFNRFAYAVPIKSKTNQEVIRGFKDTFNQAGLKPKSLCLDLGKEFRSGLMADFFKKHEIDIFTPSTNTEHKCSLIERFIQTLKNKMYKYFTFKGNFHYLDVLPKIMKAYNSAVHPAIEAAPRSVTKANQYYFWKNYHSPLMLASKKPPKKFTFNKGDIVRVSKSRHVFARGFRRGWSREQFRIVDRYRTTPIPTYSLADLLGEKVTGRFYPYEMTLSNKPEDGVHAIEKILKTRKKGKRTEYLVRWADYDSRFDSWVNAAALQNAPPS